MPDIITELARTAELAGSLRTALLACEDALDVLAMARVDQSLAEIKVGWGGRRQEVVERLW